VPYSPQQDVGLNLAPLPKSTTLLFEYNDLNVPAVVCSARSSKG
jgi:hypothetical protein